jgi:DNA-binding protein H-NS
MKVLLDIKDSKAIHLLEVLKSLPYVKAKLLTEAKAQLMCEIREAVEEIKLIREGKKKARNAEDFLNEL